MILIVDSGSSKTEWVIIDGSKIDEPIITSGINPFYQDATNILTLLNQEFKFPNKIFDAIYFYGAGCANEEKSAIVKSALAEFFISTDLFIESDLLGAARSLCQLNEGIACILGTGSNSCHYDGSAITNNISPLGFILGDEGSGAALGKALISDILKLQLPEEIRGDFFKKYPTNRAEILEKVYQQPFPNRYLAGYAPFLLEHIQNPAIEQLVRSGLKSFITRNLLTYKEINHLPIHFTGSIAYYFKPQLHKIFQEEGLILGQVSQKPISGLVKFHSNN